MRWLSHESDGTQIVHYVLVTKRAVCFIVYGVFTPMGNSSQLSAQVSITPPTTAQRCGSMSLQLLRLSL